MKNTLLYLVTVLIWGSTWFAIEFQLGEVAIRAALGLVALIVVVAIALAVWEPLVAEEGKAPPVRSYDVEIVRDDFGVPHIYGKTDADVAYGVAYAHAEDDFSTLQEVLAMTRGRAGAILGEDGAGIDFAGHAFDARGVADRGYMSLSPATRALTKPTNEPLANATTTTAPSLTSVINCAISMGALSEIPRRDSSS